jgi:hypothetical protein
MANATLCSPRPLDCGKSSLRRSAAARRFAFDTSIATS